jgi:hypothetical protein
VVKNGKMAKIDKTLFRLWIYFFVIRQFRPTTTKGDTYWCMCRVPISRVCVTFVYKEQTENEIKETEKRKGTRISPLVVVPVCDGDGQKRIKVALEKGIRHLRFFLSFPRLESPLQVYCCWGTIVVVGALSTIFLFSHRPKNGHPYMSWKISP